MTEQTASTGSPSRRATVRTEVADPETMAAALAPDNTDEMTTTVSGGRVVTRIERETTGGLQSTVDDVVVNLDVATAVIETARRHRQRDDTEATTRDTDTNTDTNT